MERQQILLVEDDADHRQIMSSLLEHVGYQVIEASDGESAIELALQLRPAVTLMDVSLPRLDGWGATLRIKTEAPDLLVVIVTAHAFPADRVHAEAAGADRYITKPVDPRELLRVVRECASGGAT
ncbi:MAG: response regulator [Gemmatimonadota bacterium]